MLDGVKFGNKHSFYDFGLILQKKELSLPRPKIETVEIPGRDGSIDLSGALTNEVTYKNRTLKLTFVVVGGINYWSESLSELANYLHGQKLKIILDGDRSFYYYGRCTIDDYKSNKQLATIVITCDVEPYKYDINVAGSPWIWDTFSFVNGIVYNPEFTVSGSKTVNLVNRRKPVSPTFTCSAVMSVDYNGNTYSLAKGKTTVYDIRLQEGDNIVTINGTGTVNVEYKGGSL